MAFTLLILYLRALLYVRSTLLSFYSSSTLIGYVKGDFATNMTKVTLNGTRRTLKCNRQVHAIDIVLKRVDSMPKSYTMHKGVHCLIQ